MSTAPKSQVVRLHIESLVVRGFDHINKSTLSAALQEALSRELRSAPSLHNGLQPRVQAAIAVPARCGADRLGDALGRTLAGIVGGDATAQDRPPRERHV